MLIRHYDAAEARHARCHMLLLMLIIADAYDVDMLMRYDIIDAYADAADADAI